ncbi:MAG: ABC transporter substrate-binding protein, partial [Vulcanimicrobiaceae bacterium]
MSDLGKSIRHSRGAFVAGLSTLALRAAPALAQTSPTTVTITYQPGLGYMPFILMQAKNELAKQFPSLQIKWTMLASGASVRDGMVANTIQIGAVGTAPFLIGWAHGLPWKVLCTANNYDYWLITLDSKIKSIKDLKPGDKIAVPAPDSINAMILRRALTRIGRNPHYLDVGLVAMPHPLAEQALLGHQIVGHIATPPYSIDEVAHGGHVIMHTDDGFPGGVTSVIVAITNEFSEQHPDFVTGFYKQYEEMAAYTIQHPDEAAKVYVEQSGGKAKISE